MRTRVTIRKAELTWPDGGESAKPVFVNAKQSLIPSAHAVTMNIRISFYLHEMSFVFLRVENYRRDTRVTHPASTT